MTTATRRPRCDAYPGEAERYIAPCGHGAPCGCNQATCCFACPLPVCKFDAGGMGRVRAQRLGHAIRDLRRRGLTADAIGETLGTTRRTVFRHLAGG